VEGQFSEFQSVSERIEEVQYEINRSLDPIAERLEGIFDSAQHAESLSDDAMNAAAEAAGETEGLRGKLQDLHQDVYHVAWKLNALLDKFGVEDPEITRRRANVRGLAEVLFREMPRRGKPDGSSYSMQEVKEEYDRLGESVFNQPGMRQMYRESVNIEEAKRWFNEGEQERDEDPLPSEP
jgi:hypothetical protein